MVQRRPFVTSGRDIWHPIFHGSAWVPRSLSQTPSVRVRDYVQLSVIADAAVTTSLILQPMTTTVSGAPTLVCNYIGRVGAGATAGNAGTPIVTNLASGFPSGRVRLHRLAFTITCLGPTAAGVLLPASHIKFGALRSPLDTNSFADFAAIAFHLGSKSELQTRSAYELMTKTAHACSYPIDYRDWENFKEVSVAASFPNTDVDDTLATLVVTISGTTTLDRFIITVHTDYDLLPADDASGAALLSSAASKHPSLADGVIQRAIQGAVEVAGVFERGVEFVRGVQAAVDSARQLTTGLPRATRAIANYARPQLALPW